MTSWFRKARSEVVDKLVDDPDGLNATNTTPALQDAATTQVALPQNTSLKQGLANRMPLFAVSAKPQASLTSQSSSHKSVAKIGGKEPSSIWGNVPQGWSNDGSNKSQQIQDDVIDSKLESQLGKPLWGNRGGIKLEELESNPWEEAKKGPPKGAQFKMLAGQAGMGFAMGMLVGGTVGFMHVAMSGRGMAGVGKVMMQSGVPFGTIFAVGSVVRAL